MNMATSLAIIIIFGLIAHYIFSKIKLPGLLGMLIAGILLGPYGFNILSSDLLKVSSDIRTIALIIILLRAGLGISKEDLHIVGKTAVKLSFIPGIIEGLTISITSIYFLKFSWIEGGILGFIIAAVSPAVVVPSMLKLIEKKMGQAKRIPTLILASASIDDVIAITIFSAFLSAYSNKNVDIITQIMGIPISITLGIGIGLLVGLSFVYFFTKYHIRDSKKLLLILAAAILLTTLEQILNSKVKIASLLGVMTIGYIILEKRHEVAKRLSIKLNKVWVLAEILLFVLVGAEVNIHVAWEAGLIGIIIISFGLIARSIGVLLSTTGKVYTLKEKLFCIIAYLPKATVQAAIGAVPLHSGVASGEIILAIAVLSILITAPLGAIGIELSAKRCL